LQTPGKAAGPNEIPPKAHKKKIFRSNPKCYTCIHFYTKPGSRREYQKTDKKL
jgi:hypothetical protein